MFDRKAWSREWYIKHREEHLRKRKEGYWNNRERDLAVSKRRYKKNRESILERTKNYQKKNYEKYNAYRRDIYQKIKQEMITAYGGKCQCPGGCDIVEPKFLSLDHEGCGTRQKKRTLDIRNGKKLGGYNLYLELKKQGWPQEGRRLLCQNCNCAWGFYGNCPHTEK
jgi:hypothetical protein